MKTREYAGQDRKETKRTTRTPVYQKLAQRAKQTTAERDKAHAQVKKLTEVGEKLQSELDVIKAQLKQAQQEKSELEALINK